MKTLLQAAVLALIAFQPAFAAEGEPSKDSIQRLLELTQARTLIDNASGQVDAAIQGSMKQALQGKEVTAEQQEIFDDMRAQMLAIFKDMLTWDEMEPIFVDIYAQSFSQQEVDGMIAFYQSPIGKAVVEKLPMAMRYSMEAMQKRIGAMMPRIQALQQQTIEKLQATRNR